MCHIVRDLYSCLRTPTSLNYDNAKNFFAFNRKRQPINLPKCDDLDHIRFLIAARKVFTCTEAARCVPEGENAPAHDAFTRLLQRQPPDPEALWQEAKVFVDRQQGLLTLDDTTLNKPYAKKMKLVTYHWSGKHREVVQGLLWMDEKIPHPLRLSEV